MLGAPLQETVVPVKSIAQEKFNQVLEPQLAWHGVMQDEMEWFANKSGTIIGTIAGGKGKPTWQYVILKRNKFGRFQVCAVGENFYDLDAARTDFLLAMAAAKKTRQTVSSLTD